MTYVAVRCTCGRPECTSWYVTKDGASVKAFSERQIKVVIEALNLVSLEDPALDHLRERDRNGEGIHRGEPFHLNGGP